MFICSMCNANVWAWNIPLRTENVGTMYSRTEHVWLYVYRLCVYSLWTQTVCV